MLHIHTLANAKKIARSLEKAMARKGLDLKHGNALDALAEMAGFADWNAYAVSLSEATLNAGLHDFELAHVEVESNEALDYGKEVALVAHTGFQLRYSATTELCDYVRVCDPLGRELMYWHEDEWAADPAIVMGAILGALVRSRPADVVQPRAKPAAVPSILDVDFFAVHAVIFGGRCYNLEWREEAVLANLAETPSPDFEDWAGQTALHLQYVEDGLVWDEYITLEQLAALRWSEKHRAFVNSEGDTYQFYLSLNFADHRPAPKKREKGTPAAALEPLTVYRLYRFSHPFKPTPVFFAATSLDSATAMAKKAGLLEGGGTSMAGEVDADLFAPYVVQANEGFYNEYSSLNQAIKVAQGLLDADEDLDATAVLARDGSELIRFEA